MHSIQLNTLRGASTMWGDLFLALKALDFKRANEILAGVDPITLLKNPWTIACMVLICIYLFFRRGDRAVVTFLSIPALIVLFEKTVHGMDVLQLEYSSQNLLFFIGGFLIIAGINVYIHFVR